MNKEYHAVLSQSSSAPIATVLQNTLGSEVIWERLSQGTFKATCQHAFPASKTHLIHGSLQGAVSAGVITFWRSDDNTLFLTTRDIDLSNPSDRLEDGLLVETAVSILVGD